MAAKFSEKVADSQRTVEQSLRAELHGLIPPAQQQQILGRLTDLVGYFLVTMGQYQTSILASESDRVFSETEKKVQTAVVPVADGVGALQKSVESISA